MTVKKSDDAVSPVIGIMLVLVVTVIIGAIVAAFATGLVGEETGPAPNAKLEVGIYTAEPSLNGIYPTMKLSHISGDPLETKDLKLTFSWDCSGGDECVSNTPGHHFSTYKYEDDGRWGTYSSTAGSVNIFGGNVVGVSNLMNFKDGFIQPLYINYGDGSTSKWGGEFFGGTFILERGMTMRAYDMHLTTGGINPGNPAMDLILNNGVIKTSVPEIEVQPDGGENYHECECGTPLFYQSEASGSLDDWTYKPVGWYCSDPGCGKAGQYARTDENGEWCPPYDHPAPEVSDGGYDPSVPVVYSAGVMACLPQGTAVDVSIIHMPTNKPIYTKTVYVQ